MTENALIIRENSALSAYQDREDVRELGDRLMAMHPAAGDVGPAAMRAVAQLALMLGANPLPGVNEVHIWKDDKGRVCMSLGINYWRRKGDDWGGYLYEVRPRPMKSNEMTEYAIPGGTIAAICKGVRAADMIKYRQMGFTTREVWDMCGRTGIGTQGPNEYAKKGRPGIWTSLKRAETDMLRQLFPAEFARIDRQAMTDAAPLVTIEAVESSAIEDADGREGTDGAEEGHYTLDDANADFGLSPTPPPTNGKPAAQPAQPPATPFDEDIAAATAAEFVPTVAAVLELTTEAIRDRMAALGYHKISGKPGERVMMFHALANYEPPAESAAQQSALTLDDPDAEAAALATARGELD